MNGNFHELEEELLREIKKKEIIDNKHELHRKIESLEANLKLQLDSSSLNISTIKTQFKEKESLIPKELVEENKRKAKIKDIKQELENFKEKYSNINNEIITIEKAEKQEKVKKDQQKSRFLEEFQSKTKSAAALVKSWEDKRQDMILKLSTMKERNEEKAKEKNDKKQAEEEEKEEKKKEKMDNYIQSLHERSERVKRENEEILNSPATEIKKKNYLFYQLEAVQKKKDQRNESNKMKKIERELSNRKAILQPIDFSAISDAYKSHEEMSKKVKEKRVKDRLAILQKYEQENALIPFANEAHYKQSLKEVRKITHKVFYEKKEILHKKMRSKSYAKLIKDNYIQKVDENLKILREEKINKRKYHSKDRVKRQHYRVKLIKKNKLNMSDMSEISDISRPKTARYKNRKEIFEEEYRKTHRPLSVNPFEDQSDKIKKFKDYYTNKSEIVNKKAEVKKPLDKKIDYLQDLKKQRILAPLQRNLSNSESFLDNSGYLNNNNPNKWKKIIQNDKYPLMSNIENMKIQINKIEIQAEQERKALMQNNNEAVAKNPEIGEKCSNLIVDAIRAKLAILDSLNFKR